MIELINDHAFSFIYYVLLVMAALTLFVLVTTVISRWYSERRTYRRELLEEELGEKIVSYVSGDLSLEEVQNSLHNRLDYQVMLKLVYKLEKSLEGVEEKRLQELMEVEATRDHFLKRFKSDDVILKAKACLYMSRRKSIQKESVREMVKLSASREPILAYAAATAVIAHGSMGQKATALRSVLYNREISRMAIGDLFVKFSRYGEEYHIREMEVISAMIEDPKVVPERKAILIRIFDELEYYHSLEFLLEYYRPDHPPVVMKALINLLAKFGVEEILPDIHQNFSVSNDPEIRKAAADAMGFFKKEESIPVLKRLLNDADYRVRYAAASGLAGYDQVDLMGLRNEVSDPEELDKLMGEILAEKGWGG